MEKNVMTLEKVGEEIGVSKQAAFNFLKSGTQKLFKKYKVRYGTSDLETLRRLIIGLDMYSINDIKDLIKYLDDETKTGIFREMEEVEELFTE